MCKIGPHQNFIVIRTVIPAIEPELRIIGAVEIWIVISGGAKVFTGRDELDRHILRNYSTPFIAVWTLMSERPAFIKLFAANPRGCFQIGIGGKRA